MRWLGVLVLGACNTTDTTAADTTADAGSPVIATAQPALDFGTVSASSGETAERTLEISNTGDGDLVIGDIAVDDEDIFVGQLYPPVVAPQGTATLTLSYMPTQDTSTDATLTIDSNDQELVVQLTGEGTAPRLDTADTQIDFGTVAIGCSAEDSAVITNTGREDLVIDALSLSAALGVTIEAPDGLPWTLAPDAQVEVPLAYSPQDASADAISLLISSNDPSDPVASVAIEGAAEDLQSSEVFVVDSTPDSDIVFAVDKSCSMSDDIASLILGFDDFLGALGESGTDFRVAAIVQDNGGVTGSTPYIDLDNVDDGTDIITEMLGGTHGAYAEQAFTLLSRAMGTGSNRPGEWIRDTAALHLIGFADEAEQSIEYSWSGYVSLFQALKADTADVTIHGIGGDYPTGCANAQVYTGVYEASIATGGGFWSICAPVAGALLDLADEIARSPLEFTLPEEAVLESITVEVGGLEESGWSVRGDQVLVLDSPQPDGTEVTVSYTPAGTCE